VSVKKPWTIIASGAVLLFIGGAAMLALKWPFTEKAVRETLEHRFARQVVIHHFHKTYFPPGCIAEEVDFLHRKRKDLPPLISVKKLVIRGSYAGLLPMFKHVPQVTVGGLHITVPPKSKGGPRNVLPLTDTGSNVPINDLDVEGALLEFRSNDPAKEPFKVFIDKITLGNVGGKGQITYRAAIKNTEPPGEIHSTGKFGPWNSEEAGDTPISGTYSYDDADLGVFGGISGKLSSQGKYSGTLAHLDCQGSADIASFHVQGGGHTVHLVSQFHGDVDATNGNTVLNDVRAGFLHTIVLSKGTVASEPGHQPGKTAELEMSVQNGRIDDFLLLFTGSPRPSMTGRISLHAKAEVPPGKAKFLSRLLMDGDFGIAGGRFTNASVQTPINHVSESARGETKQQEMEDPSTVLSDLKGHVSVRGGTATLTHVSFTVPGGMARMMGTFNLLNKQVNIKGVLYTNGKLSDATTGFKSLVLKAVTPFMKKNKMTVVPFTITGTAHHPDFALDLDGKRSF
jgi:hypothetical protein